MDFAPAEQVAQAVSAQERAYELYAEARVKMNEADRLIKQLDDEYGKKFICGGIPYVISLQGSNGNWPGNRHRLDDQKDMPVIDISEPSDTVPAMPGMRGESIMPARLADKFRKELEEMNDSDKPITFGKPILLDDTGKIEVTQDECDTQRTPPPSQPGGGACY
jgi:hypothetical protein